MSTQVIKVPQGATQITISAPDTVTTTAVAQVPAPTYQFTVPTPPDNTPPSADAGADVTITLPTNSVTLTGAASDVDGTISGVVWSKTSGAGGTITNATAATTTVTGLTEGNYIYRFTVTDNDGSSAFDERTIVVKPAPIPPPAGYTLLWQSGYDKLSDVTNEHNQLARGTVSTTVFKTGPGSFYSIPDNVSSGTRSEVQYEDTDTPTEGAAEWDARYEVIVPDNCHSLQFHPNTSGGSASPGLWHEGGKFTLVNWKGGTNTHYSTGVTIQANKWYHFRIEFKFGSAGYLRFYVDGVKVVDKSPIQVGDGSGQYLKVGFNGWDSAARNSRIYYDNFQMYKKS